MVNFNIISSLVFEISTDKNGINTLVELQGKVFNIYSMAGYQLIMDNKITNQYHSRYGHPERKWGCT